MARVVSIPKIPLHKWATGYFGLMPLPDMNGGFYAAKFDEMGLVTSGFVTAAERVACLSPLGINLLQQRFIWYVARFVAPTFRLNEVCAAVLDEADLCEEWVLAATSSGQTIEQAATAFHEWIRVVDSSNVSRQQQLAEPQRRAGVRQDMLRHFAPTF